jgi:hypothetical protein
MKMTLLVIDTLHTRGEWEATNNIMKMPKNILVSRSQNVSFFLEIDHNEIMLLIRNLYRERGQMVW